MNNLTRIMKVASATLTTLCLAAFFSVAAAAAPPEDCLNVLTDKGNISGVLNEDAGV